MVGIVLVSHSAKLAQAVMELARQMGEGKAPIALAGGIDSPDSPFGTDATKIVAAIESVYSDDGVLVLMDLGSAILSAQMAVEDLLPPEMGQRVILTDAPFVEGAVAAAVRAATGGTLAEVAAEARQGQAPKSDQLGLEPLTRPDTTPAESAGLESRVVIRNPAGLHARPAALFVQTAARFQSDITVRNVTSGSPAVNAESPTSLMCIGVKQGHEIVISATGPDAGPAIASLQQLVDDGLGEGKLSSVAAPAQGGSFPIPSPPSVPPAQAEPGSVVRGLAASEGIAVGPAVRYRRRTVVERRRVDNADAEWQRFLEAATKAKADLAAEQFEITSRVGAQDARIFEVHRQFLDDPALLDGIKAGIENDRCNVEAAVQDTIDEAARALEDLDDDLLSQRAADLRDVGNRVIRILGGQEGQVGPRLSQPSILIASDPTPSDVAQLNPELVVGLCTARGGTTSHAAILARAQGLPTVVALGDSILSVVDGTTLLVDGTRGEVQVEPAPAVVRECQTRQTALRAETARANALASQPAITRDGHQVEVAANISNVAGASQALECGAEGVGVLRTEFLYLGRPTPPDEEEQVAAYAEIARVLGERPLIIRTLDIGGDKPAPYLEMPPELNPFLGRRAIRLCLDRPALFKTQLRAILRAGAAGNVKMMFPMIATVEEIRQAKSLVEEARRELAVAGMAHTSTMDVGIMVETPAAAVIADRLAEEVDFFSIGANDLVQYTVAVDRTNPLVAGLLDPLHPAVLRLIATVVEAAHAAGRWVGVCGEMAGQPTAIPLLVGLDVDELSMSPVAIPRVKQVIRSLDHAEMRDLAQKALTLDTATAIRALADKVSAK